MPDVLLVVLKMGPTLDRGECFLAKRGMVQEGNAATCRLRPPV